MDTYENAIPAEEAAKMLQKMRTSMFADLTIKDEMAVNYGHFFNRIICAVVSDSGCECHSFEKCKIDWNSEMPSELEQMIAKGCCRHIDASEKTKKIGFYPIHVAAGLGDTPLLQSILAKGGDMYSTTLSEGLLPFDIAIINRRKEVCDQLLSQRFQYPNNGETQKAQMIALCLYFNEVDIASCCVSAGATISISHWKKLMYQAIDHSKIEVIKWLLERGIGGVNDKLRDGYTALHLANTEAVVQLLLDCGADPAIVHEEEGTPLTVQLTKRKLQVAECLVNFNPSLINQMVTDAPDSRLNHYAALHNCAYLGYLEGIKMLCKYGADHRLVTFDGNTPVGLACYSDRLTCVKYLLSLECDTNYQDHDGDTALIYASFNGNWAIVKELLDHGANPNLGNNCGVTPIWNAVYRSSIQTVKLLLLMNVDPTKPTQGRDIFGDENFNHIYDEPVTPLFVAIHRQDITIAKALICAGCNINGERYRYFNFEMYVDHWSQDDKKWLNHLSSNPPSLMWWCKRVVRKRLPLDPKSAIESLPIPSVLKSCLEDIGMP